MRKVWAAHTALVAKYKKLKVGSEELAKSKKESYEERENLRKAFVAESEKLKSVMIPSEEEPDDVNELTTRASWFLVFNRLTMML